MAVATGAHLELHGHNKGLSWTRLGRTSVNGSTTLVLEKQVSWKKGDIFLYFYLNLFFMKINDVILYYIKCLTQ